MKKLLLWSLLLLFFIQTKSIAQDCGGLVLKQGSGFEMMNYDGKGKETGKIIYKILDVSTEGAFTVFNIEMEAMNPKGKSELKNVYKMKCDGNVISMDAKSLISQEQLKSFQNMEMKFTYENIEYPTKYNVGDKLKDASVKGNGQSGPMAVNFDMMIKNRSVTGQEKLTLPAGTFDAYKIKSDLSFEMRMGFPVKMEMESISYRAPGVAWDLKTETYRKGKLIGRSELTKIY
ncbi:MULTISPECIES: TapB family protein [Dyadobacter]|uniref:DUF3108 domain-containing protein n=1 Tax=Dyadobacter chenhuakuii TaxID=2909339 RepID=A0A9X1QCV7_9BACT|nr:MULTISPECIES: hypothetical protein [Dyadobacter]MCE7072051.1 hypothetical protein [Dyadobacter sp. CY327]MCF2498048.1 hypothetical protein [Dyadobacter chenhuakuii]